MLNPGTPRCGRGGIMVQSITLPLACQPAAFAQSQLSVAGGSSAAPRGAF